MKRFPILFAFLMITTLVSAQEGLRIGARFHYNSTWLLNKNVSDANDDLDYESSFAPGFSLQAIYMFSETYGISGELAFMGHNQKYNGSPAGFEYESEVKLSYLDIPILFHVSSPKGPYFEIGPQFSFLTGAKEDFTTSPANSYPFFDDYSGKDVKDDFAGTGVGAILGFGFNIKASEMIAISLGLRFGYNFTDATTEYSEAEAGDKLADEKLSLNALFNHTDENGDFNYAKSNRAFGGALVGVQIRLQ